MVWGGKGEGVVDTRAVAAEAVAMTLFVIVGCGTACGHGAFDGATRLVVAFAFGMGILVLAYTIGHHSGGQINCAVTFSLCLGGELPWAQGAANVVGQLVGSVLGAGVLALLFPCSQDMTTNLGTNIVNEKFGLGRAVLGEALGTFLLCYVVYETAVSSLSAANRVNAVVAIGWAVFLAHVLLLPIDGCSINPTRSFGPAVVGYIRACPGFASKGLEHLWVMWVGPLLGAAAAAGAKKAFVPERKEADEDPTLLS